MDISLEQVEYGIKNLGKKLINIIYTNRIHFNICVDIHIRKSLRRRLVAKKGSQPLMILDGTVLSDRYKVFLIKASSK